jgi:hypothetical protein
MLPEIQAELIRLRRGQVAQLKSGRLPLADLETAGKRVGSLAPESDLVILQDDPTVVRLYKQAFPQLHSKIRLFPKFTFSGFHPDMIRLTNGTASATGRLHSSIAMYSWTRGLSIDQTLDLFREEVFEALGFFEYWGAGVRFLVKAGDAANLPLDRLIAKWTAQGVWMHTDNHPKLLVMADLGRALLTREGIPFLPDVEQSMDDELEDEPVWHVYPEIAKRLGCEGAYQWVCSVWCG